MFGAYVCVRSVFIVSVLVGDCVVLIEILYGAMRQLGSSTFPPTTTSFARIVLREPNYTHSNIPINNDFGIDSQRFYLEIVRHMSMTSLHATYMYVRTLHSHTDR